MNIETRFKTIRDTLKFLGGIFTPFIAGFLLKDKFVNKLEDFLFIMLTGTVFALIYIFSRGFEDNAYDQRLFKKLLQDEFDNN